MFTAKKAAPAATAREAARSRPKSKSGSLPTTTAWASAPRVDRHDLVPRRFQQIGQLAGPQGHDPDRPQPMEDLVADQVERRNDVRLAAQSIPISVSRRPGPTRHAATSWTRTPRGSPAPRSAATSSAGPRQQGRPGPDRAVEVERESPDPAQRRRGRARSGSLHRLPPLSPIDARCKPTRLRVYHLDAFFPTVEPGRSSVHGEPVPCPTD